MWPLLMVIPNLFQTENEMRSKGYQTFNVDTIQEARETVRDLRGFRAKLPIVFSDVSRLGSSQDVLLKFVEETENRIILLASRDNISPTLLSRMKRVVKVPQMTPHESNDPGVLRNLVTVEDGKVRADPEEVVRTCPSMADFLFRLDRAQVPVKHKILDLILGEEK